jgi:hypothetical protein
MNKKGIKKIISSLFLFFVVASLALTVASPSFAQDINQTLEEINKQAQLPSFTQNPHGQASAEPGASNITSAILYLADMFKYLIGTVAIIIIVASGVRLVTAGKDIEQVADKQKENLKYGFLGLIVIMLSDVAVKQVFYGDAGEIYRSEAEVKMAAQRGSDQIQGLYNMLEYFVGAIAILFIVIAGFRLVTSAGDEEVIKKSKKQVTWAVLGIVLVGLSELVIKDIVFPNQGSQLLNVDRGKELIINMTNFISAFLATLAVGLFMYGGFLYVTDVGKGDNTGNAKKIFMGAIIGLLVAMGAYSLVNTVYKFEPPKNSSTQTSQPLPDINQP